MTTPDPSDTPLLKISGLRLDGLEAPELDLDAGDIVVVSGESGSGKTRLLRAIADLDQHSGNLWLQGRHYLEFPPSDWRRQVGLLPTESHWWRRTPAAHFETPPDTETLGRFKLDPMLLSRSVGHLSTGERQRLALLRLLQNTPRVLLLDEPTASLDDDSAGRVEAEVKRYLKTQGAAAIWVSHDAAQGRRIANRQFVMEAGHLKARPLRE